MVWDARDDEAPMLPPPADPEPTHNLARLLHVASERTLRAADALALLGRLEAEWAISRSLDVNEIHADRALAVGAVSALVPALEEVEREAERLGLGLSVELENCLVAEVHDRMWSLSGSALTFLEMRRVGEGVRADLLEDRGEELRSSARALKDFAEELDR